MNRHPPHHFDRRLGVLESCLYVDDLAAAERFYADVLGLEFVSRQAGRHVFFRCGGAMVLLFDAVASRAADSAVPPHGAQGDGHLAFAVRPHTLDDWRQKLTQHGVTIEQTVRWPQGGESLYFRDPAGNSLELTTPAIWGLPDFGP